LANGVGKLTCRYASVGFAACVLALVVGCMTGPTISATPASADSLPTPSKPETAVDLLRNIKLAMQSGALLRRGFYDDANLLQYFGGNNVKSRRSDNQINGDILGLDDLVSPGLSIRFSWYEHAGRNIESALLILFTNSINVGFEDVVRVFGSSWKKAPLEPPIPHRMYDTPTRPHGNEVIIYELRMAGVVQEIRAEFRGDATLYMIYVKGRKEG
jgi:hypothetical protein